jgi:polyisoprenoid-binding protein YceI
LAIVIPLLLGGFAAWWLVLRHDAPAAVSLDSAVAGVTAPSGSAAATGTGTATSTGTAGSTGTTGSTAAGTASGTWTVDTSITNADGTGTFAGFRVDEQLVSVGAATAVGRSSDVSGTVTVEGTKITAADVTVGLSAITSNDSRRVRAINSALATSAYSTATFVLTQPVDVGRIPAEGERISVSAVGDLTVHGVTHPVTVAIDAQIENGVLVLVGSAPVTFADFGVTAPTAPVVASVDDHGVVELQLYLTQGS